MSIGAVPNQRALGINQPSVKLAPLSIVAQRAPDTTDIGFPLGTNWLDQPDSAVYVLVSVDNGLVTWVTSPASGATTLASLLVTPGSAVIDTGNLTVSVGDLTVGGDTSLTGTLDTTGAATFASTATFNGKTVVVKAVFVYYNNRWRVNRMYITPTA